MEGGGWVGGCWGCLVLRGNISKVRRKSCQINFSPFQSHPWEFLPQFTFADLASLSGWRSCFHLNPFFFSFRFLRTKTSHLHTNPSTSRQLVHTSYILPCCLSFTLIKTEYKRWFSYLLTLEQQNGFRHDNKNNRNGKKKKKTAPTLISHTF